MIQTPINQVRTIYVNTILVRLTEPKAIDTAAKPINPLLRVYYDLLNTQNLEQSLSRIARTHE